VGKPCGNSRLTKTYDSLIPSGKTSFQHIRDQLTLHAQRFEGHRALRSFVLIDVEIKDADESFRTKYQLALLELADLVACRT